MTTASISETREGEGRVTSNVMAMREHEIRSALRERLIVEYAAEPDTLIVDELGIHAGVARIDMAVVNGELHGFEIKSRSDTLERLPKQAQAYGTVFDRVTIVVSDRHAPAAVAALPDWWGVLVCGASNAEPLTCRRTPRRNASVDPFAVAQLLWRDEALAILERRGLAERLTGKPRRELWRALARDVPLAELQSAVRDALRARRTWRVDR